MAWPFDLGGIPNLRDFERFENFSIEELLQQASIPFASIAEMHTPSRNGVVMISNVSFLFTILFLLTAALFSVLLLTVMILRFPTL